MTAAQGNNGHGDGVVDGGDGDVVRLDGERMEDDNGDGEAAS
jgi:hypothetical protein